MKKKAGFTLIEMIIVMALTVVVLSIVFSIFFVGNRIFSSTDVKSTLQMEGQSIQEEITNKNIQATKVTKVVDSGNNEVSNIEKWSNDKNKTSIIEIKIEFADAEEKSGESGEYEYKKETYSFKLEDTGRKEKDKSDNKEKTIYQLKRGGKILADNVISFEVTPNGSDGLSFDITSLKKCFDGNKKYTINFDILFRNKDSNLENDTTEAEESEE